MINDSITDYLALFLEDHGLSDFELYYIHGSNLTSTDKLKIIRFPVRKPNGAVSYLEVAPSKYKEGYLFVSFPYFATRTAGSSAQYYLIADPQFPYNVLKEIQQVLGVESNENQNPITNG